MKSFFSFILFSFLGFLFFDQVYFSVAFGLSIAIGVRLFLKCNESFMFREWALLLYALNYLLAPAITYQLESEQIMYAMKIEPSNYFSLAIPGFVFFMFGMFLIPNKLFAPSFKKMGKSVLINEKFLVNATFIGILLRMVSSIFPGDFAFFIYLISMIRFVGAFSLFGLNAKKFGWLAFVVLFFELYLGFTKGMYHDAIMWLIFFILFYVYVNKPSINIKLIGALCLIFFVLFIQSIKSNYREQTWTGEKEASLATIIEVSSSKTNSLSGEGNLLSTLNRSNQAWIFASTVDRMDRVKDFQGLSNVSKYIESAILPRFLAPEKIKSGDKEIFNQFSGHLLNDGTSMGLGVFADGYIAYGARGVYVFGFVLGLIFSLTFKLVESWMKVSEFYVLLMLPMLNYAVRPDCELQTTINHLTKSIVVFGAFVYLTKYRFTLDSAVTRRNSSHLGAL